VITFHTDTGSGDALVLIHGVGLSHAMWAAQVEALAESHRVITYDMLGHGGSSAPSPDATLGDFADQLLDLLDRLSIERATLVGFSMGALVARAFALGHPERLASLVLLNGVFRREADQRRAVLARVADAQSKGPASNADAAIERWFSADYRTTHADAMVALRQAMAANDPAAYAICYRLFATEDDYGIDRLAEIRTPTLVATGEHDVGSTPAMTRALADAIPGARAVVVPDARHMMPVELPDAVNRLLIDHCSAEAAVSSGETRA
jgi:3-oxoadipate enol-lactonase